jgi:hypothetical protein
MSHPSSDPFDLSASLPKSARERPAIEWHSVENDGEGYLRYWLERAREGAQLHGARARPAWPLQFWPMYLSP